MKRGDVITVALSGDYGKPRPAVVIQSDTLLETESVLVCLITSKLQEASIYRLDVTGCEQTGLREPSQVMADKIMAARRARCCRRVGRLAAATIQDLNRMLAVVTGIAD